MKAAREIMGPSLAPHFLDNENDVYALIGALFKRGIPTAPQMKEAAADIRELISLFRQQVTLCQEATKENDQQQAEIYPSEVREYASTLFGGQINSAKRRETRINILASIINERISPTDPKRPSELQRKLVWARSSDKKCARCGDSVKWEDYDCGHDEPHAFGGRAVVSNLRVEHRSCNRRARAS
jgi:hypothetical protein